MILEVGDLVFLQHFSWFRFPLQSCDIVIRDGEMIYGKVVE